MTAGDRHRRRSGLLVLLLSFLLSLGTDAADYAKICELKYSPLVSLEYNPVTGQVSLVDDSAIDNDNESDIGQQRWRRGLTRGNSEEGDERIVQLGRRVEDGSYKFLRGKRRILNNNSSTNVFVTENATIDEKIIYMARLCPCDRSRRTYCRVDYSTGNVPDSCGLPWADDIPENGWSIDNSTDTFRFDTLGIGCFELDSKVVFSRNAWPVIFLWYGALLLFLLFTSNGKYARGYLVHTLCPRIQTNERQVERILAQRNDFRNRFSMASLRAAQHLTERPERYLRVRIPSGLSWRSGVSDEEQRHETTRWWLQQAELMGIITRAAQPQQVEYVLKTRAFNAERERARRSRMRQISAISNATSNEGDQTHVVDSVSTTSKCPSKKESGGSTAKETVATTFSDSDEEQTLTPPVDVPQNIYCEDDDMEVFDCSICLTEIEEGEQVGILPCIHIFHVDCLRQWITRKNACPLCQVTEIASPRPVELETGRRVSPPEDETTTAEGSVPSAEGGSSSHENISADATPNNTSVNGTPWLLLNPFSSTLDRSALVHMEQRRFRREQMQQQRHRRRGQDLVINLHRR